MDITAAKNEEMFAELIQFLDDKSLALVMRDAQVDGRKALKILRAHYAGTGKPRVISLYTELTSLVKSEQETVTDYVIRTETAATALRNAGETVTDSLLIAMVLKGLPEEYKPFVVVVTQSDKEQKFSEFKLVLRSFVDSERTSVATGSHSVMKTEYKKESQSEIASVISAAIQGTLLASVRAVIRNDEDSGVTRAITHLTVAEHVDAKGKIRLTT